MHEQEQAGGTNIREHGSVILWSWMFVKEINNPV